MKAPNRSRWWVVRKELEQSQATVLMALSFLLPLLVWCVASYGPWWKVAYQVNVPAESARLQSVYTVGDRLTPDVWTEFSSAIAKDNEEILAARTSGRPLASTARQNKKVVRQIHTAAVANGWLTREQELDDDALRKTWIDVASGRLEARKEPLTGENLEIVKANSAMLADAASAWPTEALLKLMPQASEEVSRPVYLVPPDVVATSFWKGITAGGSDGGEAERKTLLQRYGESWRTIVLGFLLAIAVAIPLGVLCGTYDFASKLAEPFVNFFSYMPAPAFGVVLMAIFGLDLGPKIMLVFLGTLPSAILTISKTTRSLDGSLLEAAQTLGANQRQLITTVVIPGILPSLYKDLRLLFGTAWTWLVIAELLGFKSGLAEIIDTHGRRFQFDIVYPAILLIGLSGFFMDQVLAYLARYFFPWMDQPKKGFLSRFFSGRARILGPARQPVASAPEAPTTSPS
ncbi:MAG: ABC transporter permease [Verrucomicrobiota bacterium]